MGRLGDWFDLSDPDTCTAKALVGAQLQVLPDPDVQLNDPGTDWPTVWQEMAIWSLQQGIPQYLVLLPP